MSDPLSFVRTLALVVATLAVLLTLTRFAIAWIDGKVDADYPTVAAGDFRAGMFRRAYLAGRAFGERAVARNNARMALTRARTIEDGR